MSLAETKEDYIDGFTYYDYRRKKWYTYNNGRFIPVEQEESWPTQNVNGMIIF